jgi:uncharacterized protein YbaR (Trm112 family)
MTLPKAVARYEKKVHIECPTCKFNLQVAITNSLNITNVPQVGEILTCSSCGTLFRIDSEELY